MRVDLLGPDSPPPSPPGVGGVGGAINWPDLRHQPGIQSSFDWRGNMDILYSPFQILALTSLLLFPSFPPFIQIHSLLPSFLFDLLYVFSHNFLSSPHSNKLLLSYTSFRFLSFSFHSFIPFSHPIRLLSFIPCSSFRQMFSFLFCLIPPSYTNFIYLYLFCFVHCIITLHSIPQFI
jgi:hypothetical protein